MKVLLPSKVAFYTFKPIDTFFTVILQSEFPHVWTSIKMLGLGDAFSDYVEYLPRHHDLRW